MLVLLLNLMVVESLGRDLGGFPAVGCPPHAMGCPPRSAAGRPPLYTVGCLLGLLEVLCSLVEKHYAKVEQLHDFEELLDPACCSMIEGLLNLCW